MILPGPFKPLGSYRQFISYKLVARADGSTDKLPIDPRTGQVCNAHDPGAWMTAGEVQALGLPLAFVFTKEDPFFFVDVDHCLDGGAWTPEAMSICAQFPGCAMEVSQSGEGLHIFGTVPEDRPHSSDNKDLGTQFYTSGRFVALTGTGATGNASTMPTRETWAGFINMYFPPKASAGPGASWSEESVPEWTGLEDDDALIKKMLATTSARSVIGGSATVRQLWEADAVALGVVFPDPARTFDWSSADAALLSHLAFWTGKNHGRMLRLFERSALADRDKWREREEYRINTILYSAGACRSVYKQPLAPMAPGALPVDIISLTYAGQKGSAGLFINQNQDQLCYDHSSRLWYQYKGHFWAEETTGMVIPACDDVQDIYQQASADISGDIIITAQTLKKTSDPTESEALKQKLKTLEAQEKAVRGIFRNLNNLAYRKQVVEFAAQGPDSLGISGNEWDQKPWHLPCPNGVIDLKTGHMEPGNPKDYLKAVCPTEYHQGATCPIFKQTLLDIFNNDLEMINFIQRVFGMSLVGLNIEHVLIVLWGKGRNGKDTLLEAIKRALGDDMAGAVQSAKPYAGILWTIGGQNAPAWGADSMGQ